MKPKTNKNNNNDLFTRAARAVTGRGVWSIYYPRVRPEQNANCLPHLSQTSIALPKKRRVENPTPQKYIKNNKNSPPGKEEGQHQAQRERARQARPYFIFYRCFPPLISSPPLLSQENIETQENVGKLIVFFVKRFGFYRCGHG